MATGANQYYPGFEVPGFTTEVEALLRASMHMGLPEVVELRPTFFFDDGPTFDPPTSTQGKPFSRTSPASDVPDEAIPDGDGVQILCVVEEREGEADETLQGSFEAKEYIVTFLPAEWEGTAVDANGNPDGKPAAKDFTYVYLGGKRFNRSYGLNPVGLFDTGVHQVRVEAEDI